MNLTHRIKLRNSDGDINGFVTLYAPLLRMQFGLTVRPRCRLGNSDRRLLP